MAEVNTSIFSPPQGQNALQQAAAGMGVANAYEQNKLLKGQQVQQQTAIDVGKLELVQKQLGAFRNLLSPLINKPDVSNEDVYGVAEKAIQQGLAKPQQVMTELVKFPRKIYGR